MSGTSRYDIDIVANNKASRALGNVTKQLGNIERGAGKANNAFDKMKTLAVAAGAALGSMKLAQSFMQTATQFENLNVQLKFITGSAKDGAAALKIVEQAAASSAFAMEDMAAAAPSLLTVSSVEQLADTLDMAGDIAAATGMGFQEAAGQLQRAFSGGIAAADIFREKGVKSMLGFQEGVQYTAEQTEKMIRDAFENGTTSLKGATAEMAKTWDGQISMMGDAWTQFKKKTMDSGLFEELKLALQGVQRFINDNEEAINKMAVAIGDTLGKGVRKLGEAVAFVATHSDFFLTVAKGLVAVKLAPYLLKAAKAMRVLNLAMMANPIGAVVGSIALLIGYFVGKNGLGRTIVQVQTAFDILGDAMSRFGKFIKNSLAKVVEFFKGKIDAMKQGLINAYNAIAGFIPGMKAFEEKIKEGAGVLKDKFTASLEYAETKVGDFGDKLAENMPDGFIDWVDDSAQAILDAGDAYDESQAKVKAFADEQRRLLDMERAMSSYGPRNPGAGGGDNGTNDLLETTQTTLGKTAELVKSYEERYKEFFQSTVEGAKDAADMIMFKQQAIADLGQLLKDGKINIDQYAQGMVEVGHATKAAEEEIKKIAEPVSTVTSRFREFYNSLIDRSKAAIERVSFTQQAAKKLFTEFDNGRISVEMFTEGMDQLGLANTNTGIKIDENAQKIQSLTDKLFPQEAALSRIKDQMSFVEEQRTLGNIADEEAIRLTQQLQVEYDKTSGKTKELAEANRAFVESLSGYKDRIMLIAEANAKLKTENETLATSMTRLDQSLFPVQAKMDRLKIQIADVELALERGIITQDQYNKLVVALRKELALLGPQLGEYPDRILRIAEAQKRAAETAKELADAQKTFTDDISRLNDQLFPIEAEMRRYEKNLKDIDKAYKDGIIGQEQYIKMSAKVREEMKLAGQEFKETTDKMKTSSGEFIEGFNKDFNDRFVDGLMNGNLSFNTFADMWKQTLGDLLKDTLNGGNLLNDILGGFGKGIGGGSGGGFGNILGGLFSGGGADGIGNFGMVGDFFGGIGSAFGLFADGGKIKAGETGIVGEAGAELVSGPATVTSNQDSFGGNAPPVNITIQAIDTQTGTEFLLKNKRQIEGIIQGAYNRRGKQGIY